MLGEVGYLCGMAAPCELCTGVSVYALRQLYVLDVCEPYGHARSTQRSVAHPTEACLPSAQPCPVNATTVHQAPRKQHRFLVMLR